MKHQYMTALLCKNYQFENNYKEVSKSTLHQIFWRSKHSDANIMARPENINFKFADIVH
jgi:hypothetical protein